MLVSSGEIRDRSKEMLSTGDVAIVRLYKTLLNVARQVQAGGEPVGLHIDPRRIRGANGVIATDQPWQSLVPEHERPKAAAQGVPA